MPIVDRYGRPMTRPERAALGFVERTLPEREQEVLNGITTRPGPPPESDHDPMRYECR